MGGAVWEGTQVVDGAGIDCPFSSAREPTASKTCPPACLRACLRATFRRRPPMASPCVSPLLLPLLLVPLLLQAGGGGRGERR